MTGSALQAMAYREYVKLRGLRWSTLKHMNTSPKHFRHAELNPDDGGDTTSKLIGRAVHAGVLEPHRYTREFATYTKRRAGAKWEEFKVERPGFEILNAKEHDAAQGTIDAVLRDPAAREYLDKGVAEGVIQWTDLLVDEDCKCRFDLVNGHLIELKSTHAPKPERFASLAANLFYPEQLAFYRMGLRANGIDVAPEAIVIAAETAPPHDVVVFTVDESIIDYAEMKVARLLQRVQSCRKADYWPGISDFPIPLAMPAWWSTQGDDTVLTFGGKVIEP